jgi:urease accessory protein
LTTLDDAALLTLLQLHDSALPIGAFAYSGGIEAYAQEGMTADGLAVWLRSQLRLGFGRLDLAAIALAYDAATPAAFAALEEALDAHKPVASLRAASRALGRRTDTLARRLWPDAAERLVVAGSGGHHALVLGDWSRALALPRRATLLAAAQGMVSAALSAGNRCLPLAPARAQRILTDLQSDVCAAVARVEADPAASLWSALPGAELRAAAQPQLRSRLFES